MIGIELLRNGEILCQARMVDACVLSVSLRICNDTYGIAQVEAAGTYAKLQGEECVRHWRTAVEVRGGDSFRFRFGPLKSLSPLVHSGPMALPIGRRKRKKTETPDNRSGNFIEEAAPRIRSYSIDFRKGTGSGGRAALCQFEKHLFCSILWDKWHGKVCRAYVRSYGSATIIRHDMPDWFCRDLDEGDSLTIALCA